MIDNMNEDEQSVWHFTDRVSERLHQKKIPANMGPIL